MSEFLNTTISDMRSGRQSWRVMAILSTTSTIISVAMVVLRGPF